VSRVGYGGGGVFRGPGEELQDAGQGGSYLAHSDVRAAQCSDGMRAGYGGPVRGLVPTGAGNGRC
jgi:hypothetical protein